VGAKALPALPPARCLPCTLYWTYVSLSLCDTSLWYVSVSKSSIFRTLFPRLFKRYTVVYISCCRSVLFYIDHLNQESFLQLKKQQSRRQFPQPRGVGAVWKYILFSRISLHTTPVYWVWVAVYRCRYFEASFSLILHWSPESRIFASVKERARPETVFTTTRSWRCLEIYFFQKLYAYYTSLLGLSCCIQLSIFSGSVHSYLTLINRVKNLCFSRIRVSLRWPYLPFEARDI